MTRKVSVSLPEADIVYLASVSPNRSAAMHAVIELARRRELVDAYADAYAEWQSDDDAKLWDAISGDGVE